jgi:hypothetical protein
VSLHLLQFILSEAYRKARLRTPRDSMGNYKPIQEPEPTSLMSLSLHGTTFFLGFPDTHENLETQRLATSVHESYSIDDTELEAFQV